MLNIALRTIAVIAVMTAAGSGPFGRAQAYDPALSLLPQEQPAARPPSTWNFFRPVQPAPVEPEASREAAEEEAQPAPYRRANVPLPPVVPRRGTVAAPARPQTAPGVAADQTETTEIAVVKEQTAYRAVRVPLPPVISRADRSAPTRKAAEEPITIAEPPQPRPTGLFAMLAAYSAPERPESGVASDGDSARPVLAPPPTSRVAPQAEPGVPSARTTKLDLSDPFRPKRLKQSPDERDDDLDDEGGTKLVEKQVDSVEIQCLKPELMAMIYKAGDHFGATPVITSGFRNRGRRGSHHRKCEAADFFIPDVASATLVRYLRNLPGAGGVGTYCHTKSVHLDTGEPRNWHQCGRRRSFALRSPVTEIGSR